MRPWIRKNVTDKEHLNVFKEDPMINRGRAEREFFVYNLLVRIHFIIEMIWWTGLAPLEFGFLSPISPSYTFLSESGLHC